jgi:hypothetical protein
MSEEIPEIPEEFLIYSKKCLKRISELLEQLNNDINSEQTAKKMAAMAMTHNIMKICIKKEEETT